MEEPILKASNVSISFKQYTKGLGTRTLTPVKSLDIEICSGKILAVVGASGSGKSLLAHAIMGILPANATVQGEMRYKGIPITSDSIRRFRGTEIAFIPQSVNYLDPLMKVGPQVKIGLPRDRASQVQAELFNRYGLSPEAGGLYPGQLSGGMLRRVLFATSVRDNIKLVIADEPTPGIHPEALKAILDELRRFADAGMAVMLITHDIVSALTVCDDVTVFKQGSIVETAPAKSFSGAGDLLKTRYARQLWRSLPQNDFTELEDLDDAAL